MQYQVKADFKEPDAVWLSGAGWQTERYLNFSNYLALAAFQKLVLQSDGKITIKAITEVVPFDVNTQRDYVRLCYPELQLAPGA